MRISDILKDKNHRLVTVPATASIREAVSRMREERVGALIVRTGNGRLIGVLSERDIVLGLHAHGTAVLDTVVEDVMTLGAPVASPSDSITGAMKVMTEMRARHLPVIAGGVVVGLVSTGDITKYRLAEKTEENSVLQDLARASLANAA
jgi:CBS domain-containing protein